MRQSINKYDFYDENFEKFFVDYISAITPQQKLMLPMDLKLKLFNGDKVTHGNLSFKEKVYILNTVFEKKVQIVIEDEKEGLSMEDYMLAKKVQAGKRINKDLLAIPRVQASFVMADKNLFQSIAYFNHLYTTEIYRLYKRIYEFQRTQKDINYAKGRDVVRHVSDLILSYEMVKKTLVMTNGLNPGKLYALLYFSVGEKFGADFIRRDFKASYNCNAVMLSKAIKELTDTGYLSRRDKTTKYRYTLTAKGSDVLNRILDGIIKNYKAH